MNQIDNINRMIIITEYKPLSMVVGLKAGMVASLGFL
jgi:hypothetical protein